MKFTPQEAGDYLGDNVKSWRAHSISWVYDMHLHHTYSDIYESFLNYAAENDKLEYVKLTKDATDIVMKLVDFFKVSFVLGECSFGLHYSLTIGYRPSENCHVDVSNIVREMIGSNVYYSLGPYHHTYRAAELCETLVTYDPFGDKPDRLSYEGACRIALYLLDLVS